MNDRGSILIEAIVASAIVAMILAACYQVIGDGARRERRAGLLRLAALTAQSQLAAVGTTIPLDGGSSGVDGTVDWRVVIQPSGDAPGGAGQPVLVTVTASDQEDPNARVVLRSLRLAPTT
jgi:hypothetical protein